MRVLFLALACLTLQDLQNAKCNVLCSRDGYSLGTSVKGQCQCIDVKGSPERYAKRAVDLGNQNPKETDAIVGFDQTKAGNLTVYPRWDDYDR